MAWWGRGGAQNALVEKYNVIDFFSGRSAKVDLPGALRSAAGVVRPQPLAIIAALPRILRVGQRAMAGTRSFQHHVVALDDPNVVLFSECADVADRGFVVEDADHRALGRSPIAFRESRNVRTLFVTHEIEPFRWAS